MDIKDSYLHGTVGVVKSISVDADKLKYKLADIAGTVKEVTLPVATQTANGLLSKEDKKKLDNMIATKVANDLILKINSGTTEGTSLYTYNGSATKTLDIKLGSNVTLTAEANSLTIAASDTKVTQTNTTGSASYRVLFSGNDNDTTETTTARKSANLLFNPSTGKLTAGHLSIGGDIIFTGSNKDQYLYYYHNDAWAWRTGHQGTGTSDTNYFVIQNQTSGTVTTALKIDYNAASKATFIGTVVAPTFQGNLDGTYVNALTGYTKATSAADLAATDTLNSALGKLEYKAGIAYDLVTKANDSDGTIENLKEILDVLAGIKDTETIKAIVGKYLPLTGGTLTGSLSVQNASVNVRSDKALLRFLSAGDITYIESGNRAFNDNAPLKLTGYNGFTGSDLYLKFNHIYCRGGNYTNLDSGNTYINNGTITINGNSITPLTSHQSLANYVTLNTNLTITGVKTFSSLLEFTVALGTSPFTVTSTTKVANLNADYLDGMNSTDFKYVKVGEHSYTPNLAYYGSSTVSSSKYYKLSVTKVNSVWTMMYIEISVKENCSTPTYGKLLLHVNKNNSNGISGFYLTKIGKLSDLIKAYACNTSSSFDIYIAGNWSYPTINIDRVSFGDTSANTAGKVLSLSVADALPSSYSTAAIINGLTSDNSSVSGGGSSWGSSITVNLGGVSKTLTIPSNPNTDLYVNQSSTTTSSYRPLICGYTTSSTAGSSMETNVTNVVYASNKFYVQPSTGNLYATLFNGVLNTTSNLYYADSKYGILMNNSDIIGTNAIYFGDAADSAGEGINFYRSSTTWDSLTAAGGVLYFSANRATATHTLTPVFSSMTNTSSLLDITIGGLNRKLTIAYASSAGSATKVIMNQNITADYFYPIVWTNSNNTTNAVAADLLKSYSKLIYNPAKGMLKVNDGNILVKAYYTGNHTEGIRLAGNTKSSAWSIISFGCDPDADNGTHADQWLVGRDNSDRFLIRNYNTPLIYVLKNGNVGIGTDAPPNRLTVTGGSILQLQKNTWLNSANLMFGRSDVTIYTDRAVVGVTNGNLHLDSYSGYAIYFNHYVGTAAGLTKGMVLSRAGNLGIGAEPTEKLHVAGNAVANNFGIQSTDGTGDGISLFGGVSHVSGYGIAMVRTATSGWGTHGQVSGDWATYFNMGKNGTNKRGWIFRSDSTNVASIGTGGEVTAAKFIGNLNHTLTFSAGTFAAKTYNNSAAVTVNIPTHTSHLTNNSGFLTAHLSLANYVTLNGALTISGVKTFSTQLKFTVALGTSPFTVTSTTKVANLNADMVDGYHVSGSGEKKPWGGIVSIGNDGVSEMGRYINFHYDNNTGSDYSTRLLCDGNHSNVVTLPSATGTLALTSQIPTDTWRGITDSYSGTDSTISLSQKGAKTLFDSVVKAYATRGPSDSINSDWGQSMVSFDPICNGTYPSDLSNTGRANVTLLNLGNNYNRRKQLLFNWNSNDIYYRRRNDGYWTSWARLAIAGESYTKTEADSRFVNYTGDTMTGNLTVPQVNGNLNGSIVSSTPQLAKADESNNINIVNNANSAITTNSPENLAAITKAIRFRWYDTYWEIGNIRGLSTNSKGFGISSGNSNLRFRVTASGVYAYGNMYAPHFYESSDIKLKTNIVNILSSDNIPQLKEFDWKSDGKHSYGLIAQELEDMGYSELVEDSGDHKTVNYSAALSLIVGKLQVKIRELEKEIENLKNKN